MLHLDDFSSRFPEHSLRRFMELIIPRLVLETISYLSGYRTDAASNLLKTFQIILRRTQRLIIDVTFRAAVKDLQKKRLRNLNNGKFIQAT